MHAIQKHYLQAVNAYCILLIAILLQACSSSFDLSSAADRAALKEEIRKALTAGKCERAIDLAEPFYDSIYSDNEVRALYANAHQCRVGISFYGMVDDFVNGDVSASGIWETVVAMFPSRTDLDTKFQSVSYAQDAIQAIWNRDVVVSDFDAFYRSSFNPGSVWYRDRPNHANTSLFFNSLAIIGTVLNRYGYTSVQVPSDYSYQQKVVLPWLIYVAGIPDIPNTLPVLKADTTGSACGLASGLLNLIDAMNAMKDFAQGTIAATIDELLTNIEGPMNTSAHTACMMLVGATDQQCDDARRRLRFREACDEDDKIAMTAVGLVFAIDQTWTDAP
jgi:hypothetical protein